MKVNNHLIINSLAALVLSCTINISVSEIYSDRYRFRNRCYQRRDENVYEKRKYKTPTELMTEIYEEQGIKQGQILKFDQEKAIDRELSLRIKQMERYKPDIKKQRMIEQKKYDEAEKRNIIETKRLYDVY